MKSGTDFKGGTKGGTNYPISKPIYTTLPQTKTNKKRSKWLISNLKRFYTICKSSPDGNRTHI